jgi:hypothetical protein
MVEDQQGSQAGQMNQTTQVLGLATTSSNLDNGLSESNHLIVPADTCDQFTPESDFRIYDHCSASLFTNAVLSCPMLKCRQSETLLLAGRGRCGKEVSQNQIEMNFERFMARMESTMDVGGDR